MSKLKELEKQLSGGKKPPLHKWQPEFTGELDMQIKADGQWFYQGGVISRAPLVKLFSSILRKEGDEHFLVTPVEKYRIEVEDAPFVAVEVEVESAPATGTVLRFRTNAGDVVSAGADHPLVFDQDPNGQPAPYVLVRDGLTAKLTRPVFYALVEMAQEQRDSEQINWRIESQGQWYVLDRMPLDQFDD